MSENALLFVCFKIFCFAECLQVVKQNSKGNLQLGPYWEEGGLVWVLLVLIKSTHVNVISIVIRKGYGN